MSDEDKRVERFRNNAPAISLDMLNAYDELEAQYERLRQKCDDSNIGVLPLYIDDGTSIICGSISGGTDSTNGEPNSLTLIMTDPNGTERHVRYTRSTELRKADYNYELGAQRERERIAALVEDTPRWCRTRGEAEILRTVAAAIRNDTVSKDDADDGQVNEDVKRDNRDRELQELLDGKPELWAAVDASSAVLTRAGFELLEVIDEHATADDDVCVWHINEPEWDLWKGACGFEWNVDHNQSIHNLIYCPRCRRPIRIEGGSDA